MRMVGRKRGEGCVVGGWGSVVSFERWYWHQDGEGVCHATHCGELIRIATSADIDSARGWSVGCLGLDLDHSGEKVQARWDGDGHRWYSCPGGGENREESPSSL